LQIRVSFDIRHAQIHRYVTVFPIGAGRLLGWCHHYDALALYPAFRCGPGGENPLDAWTYGTRDGSAYRYRYENIGCEEDKDLGCHYVYVRVLFRVLNVKKAENMAITATGIKNIWYADPAKVTGDLTGTMLGSILKDPTTKKVPNVHQDTWSLDEAEPSTTQYKNQLTDGVYRQSKEMGEVTMNFAIGQYDDERRPHSWAEPGRRRRGNGPAALRTSRSA